MTFGGDCAPQARRKWGISGPEQGFPTLRQGGVGWGRRRGGGDAAGERAGSASEGECERERARERAREDDIYIDRSLDREREA